MLPLALGLLLLAVPARAEIVVRDAVGREVRLVAPARRIVTNDSLLLYSLALIDPDPVARLAGWATPRRIDSGVYAAFRERFPAIEAIPDIGGVVPGNVSVEGIVSLAPDLFVVSLWEWGWEEIAGRLEAFGIPVIFLDTPRNLSLRPAEATALSITILGRAIGQEAKAEDYAAFVRERYAVVESRLAGRTTEPSVLIDVHAGTLCCFTPGSDNRITQYLALAGGRSIATDVASGYDGRLGPEFVLDRDPAVYIATGSPHLGAMDGLVVGGDVEGETARASLDATAHKNFLDGLSAVRKGRAHAVSHQFAITPLSVLVFECFAKWLHPERMADIDPLETLAEINARFMAVPLEGTFWTSLDAFGGEAR